MSLMSLFLNISKTEDQYLLTLYFHKRYGYKIKKETECVIAVWDSSCECFRESTTKMEIDSRDISEWWKDI
nr:MAG TPA: Heat shock protein HspQ shock protein, DNA BINDING [Caudoviricetes sp.]